jgi:hypothetical protein
VNIFRLEFRASFFITTYHNFWLSLNIFRLQYRACFLLYFCNVPHFRTFLRMVYRDISVTRMPLPNQTPTNTIAHRKYQWPFLVTEISLTRMHLSLDANWHDPFYAGCDVCSFSVTFMYGYTVVLFLLDAIMLEALYEKMVCVKIYFISDWLVGSGFFFGMSDSLVIVLIMWQHLSWLFVVSYILLA